MTTTIQNTDLIVSSGTAFTFAADNDILWLTPGTIIASGTAQAIDGSILAGLGLFIDGEVFAGTTSSAVSMSGGTANVVIGATGSVNSNANGQSAMYVAGGGNSVLNDGEIHASRGVGIAVKDGNNDVHNRGTIYGESDGVFLGVLGLTTGDVLVNEGTIAAGNSTQTDARSNHGVTTEANDTQIINYGTITASHATGAGVNIGSDILPSFGGNGSRLENHGSITSVRFWGVDLSNLRASMKAEVFNDGLISGGTGGVRGNANDDHVVNRGTIDGDVSLGDGNDTYDGRDGHLNSAVLGGTGNDTYIIDGPTIALVENAGEGTDLVKAASSFTLGANIENLTLIGAGNTRGVGNGLANTITGNSGDNVLNGLGGSDSLHGHTGDDVLRGASGTDLLVGDSGDDRLYGGTQNDTLQGGDDDDTLDGGDGNDKLVGGNDDDTLYGGAGNDIVNGGAGDDHLVGGLGKDIYTGGTGADVFVFRSAMESVVGSNRDQLKDFHHAQGDLIDLSAIDANTATNGDDGFTIVASYSHTAGELRITTGSGNSTIHGDINGDAHDDFQIFAKGVIDLTAADFVL